VHLCTLRYEYTKLRIIILVKFERHLPVWDNMEFTLHKDFSEIPAPVWNALAGAGITDTPFTRHEMLSLWWQSLGGGEWKEAELVLVSASENGELIGIAPLFKAEYDGRPTLLLVGSIEVSDYLDLIVCADDLPRFVAGLFDFLAQSGTTAGLPFDWYNLPDSSPSLPALKAEAEKRGWAYQEEIYRPTPRIGLDGDFDAYLARIDKNKGTRSAVKCGGPLRVVRCNSISSRMERGWKPRSNLSLN